MNDYQEWLRQNWKRDLLALPIVVLLTMIATDLLFPGITLPTRALVAMVLSAGAWPIGLWVVDHTVRKQ